MFNMFNIYINSLLIDLLMRNDEYFIGIRVDKQIWDYLHRYKNHSRMSTVVRDMIYDRMETEDPIKILDDMVDGLERGEYDPDLFVKRFYAMKQRYRKNEALYSLGNEKIAELEKNGVLHNAVGRLRLQQEDMDNFI